MFEHVQRPWKVASEIGRILKPGGVCIITAPFLVPYHADPYDFFRYTKEGLESLFKNEGFTIEESGQYGRTASVLIEMMHFAHFSHYKTKTESGKKWRWRIMRKIKSLSYRLDSIFKNKAIYANSYVVARKKA
jgi:SAM-dependent methyltransferase